MTAECGGFRIVFAWFDCQEKDKLLVCDKHSSLLHGAELPQSQIPDTIVRGSGRFHRTVKTIARIRFIRMWMIGLSLVVLRLNLPIRDLLVATHGYHVCRGMIALRAQIYSQSLGV
jgi:hypothetical protein